VQAERAAQERAVIASGAAPEAPVFDALEAGASGATLVKRLIEGAKTLQMISPAAATTMTPGAAIATPRAAAAGPVVTNSPTTNIDVTVDAQGQERPADIAEQVARQVDTVLERRDRQMIQSFATAVAGGG
jgi:carboxylesterase type B